MAPIKCSYTGCMNTSSNHSIFRFPVNDQNRLKIWLENAGNMTLASLTDEELKNRFLCKAHFDPNLILSEGLRTRLHKDAVPQPFSVKQSDSVALDSPEVLKVKTPTKVYGKRKCELTNDSPKSMEKDYYFPSPTKPKRRRLVFDPLPEQVKKLKMSIADSTKLLKRKNRQLSKLKKNLQNKRFIDVENFPFKSDASKVLTKMQLKKKSKKWTEEEKNFCLSLHYKSPAVYKFLRKSGVILASPTTIRSWLAKASCLPGIRNESFYNLKNTFSKSSDKEKACVICFDEMSIMSCLEFTNKYDIIEGFEDFGAGKRSDNVAKYALVFVARGLYYNWKVPLCFFLSGSNVKADTLYHLIRAVLQKVFECGLLPKCTTCDQGTTNVSALKKLGATVDTPYFELDGRKIFAIFDVPHIIKNIRNNLLKENFTLNGEEINFQDIVQAYEIDKKNKSRSMKKITPIHLNPNSFQKMRVSLATQVFSHTVASSIKTAVATGEHKSVTALNTAKFVDDINNLFDALNSRNKMDKNPYKCALSSKDNLVRQTLTSGLETAKKLRKITLKRNGTKEETVPPCFLGLQQTIAAILQLFNQEHAAGIKYILTNRLNQDVIENLFGLFRMKTGCNRNPTARVLRAVFRSNLLNSLMKLDTTNCEPDKDEFIAVSAIDTSDINVMPSTSTTEVNVFSHEIGQNHEFEDVEESKSSSCLEDQETQSFTLEQCSVTYFSGWLAKKTVEKFKCEKCKSNLLHQDILNDKNQLLILNKSYSNIEIPTLQAPSSLLQNIVDVSLTVFEEYFYMIKHKQNVSKKIVSCIKTDLECKKLNLMLLCNEENHSDFLIEKLVTTKIHFYCKTEKKKMSEQATKKIRVLKNL